MSNAHLHGVLHHPVPRLLMSHHSDPARCFPCGSGRRSCPAWRACQCRPTAHASSLSLSGQGRRCFRRAQARRSTVHFVHSATVTPRMKTHLENAVSRRGLLMCSSLKHLACSGQVLVQILRKESRSHQIVDIALLPLLSEQSRKAGLTTRNLGRHSILGEDCAPLSCDSEALHDVMS